MHFRIKLVEGKDCFILEACFADTVFNTMGQPFSKPNEVQNFPYFFYVFDPFNPSYLFDLHLQPFLLDLTCYSCY